MYLIDVLVSSTTMLNGGDAAIVFAMIGILRKAFGNAMSLTFTDRQPELAAQYYPELGVQPTLFEALERWRPQGWRRTVALFLILLAARLWRTPAGPRLRRLLPGPVGDALARVAEADLVMAPGGTYLVPTHRYLPHLLEILAAYAAHRPYVLFTQSLGPFPKGKRASRLTRFLLRRARLILVRDAQSARHLAELGIAADRVIECADSVFALPGGPDNQPRRTPGADDPLKIAISVRDWGHFATGSMEGYLTAVAALVETTVARHGAEVTFLSTCQGTPGYWYDDAETADRVVALLPEPLRARVAVERGFHTPQQIVALLRDFDAVVATRMHFGILGLVAGTPVLPIAYEFKTHQLYEKFGLGGFVQDIETLTPESLYAAFERMRPVLGALAEKVATIVTVERADAMAAGMLVRDSVQADVLPALALEPPSDAAIAR